MNPNIDKMPVPEMSLPGLTQGGAIGGVENPVITPEVSRVESSASFSRTPVAVNPSIVSSTPLAVPLQSPSTSSQPISGRSNATTSQTAGAQEIEKEYVSKAKAIIAQTKTDPYIQSKELSKVKAEFIKKQYGKDIKLSER